MLYQKLKKLKNDNCIFGDIRRPILPKKVNLIYWKTRSGKDNVGDLLSKVVFDFMLAEYNLKNSWLNKTYRMTAIGSVIQTIQKDTCIWGSGLLTASHINELNRAAKLDIRAVRGPETKRVLERYGYSVPEVYGDPGILLPDFFSPGAKKIKDFVIVPHFTREKNYQKFSNVISTLTTDWRDFIEQLVNSKLVISSSLHGIILAEAYGIPAIMLNDIEYDKFKYNDYYESTGRKTYNIVDNIEDALKLNCVEKASGIDSLKNGLYSSFPQNLFSN
ncbi:polysaccharide pyruvyl transferase family protein [Klebsiella spallanzanii]|uniref:Polysaccharide pyruvyl transferase domain-containing protein n=1 Tax=Klebsiella spallanzanii TaxID=2587528 RepID=A0A564K3Y1_9ENTR|nr:polysaccharide pyruvyl transferase family protein [Klebsiella spallanzanii]VUS63839.1 hypothetical protein SB6408_00725 [Klebsiella spallanzanii]